ncbi:hypothetical protein MACH26_37650 [Planctobacterium marinum]|uniref:Uncharacterized protein n=2 Tax=Planctobacterium marinum TaxID=1631968 RepID=A0AA48HN31_9ALTE|nr:hypothetical protein MACH26_37650 [Planctobacterium marinum]
MQVEQELLDKVEAKLNRQNALKAALLVPFWCLPLLVTWYWVFHNYGKAVPMFLLASGIIIGLAIRFHGRGFIGTFSLIALIAHLLLVAAATLSGLLLGKGETIWAVILLGLYIGGAWLASFLARIQIPFLEQRAYFLLAEKTQHPSAKRWRNKWFLALPSMCILSASLLFITMIGLYSLDEYNRGLAPYVAEQKAQDTLQKRAINVTPASLDKLSTKEALRHVYAYSGGELISASGHFIHTYPLSNYKAQTILKYLIEHRDNVRAKFLLGLLTEKEHGQALIEEAADAGDIYAKIHLAAQFACYDKPEIARDLLNRLRKTTRETHPRGRINRILSIGFGQFCAEKDYSPVSIEYVL